jgi:uncharacterized damage-inducible protein DinB|nr:MAG: damage-inducible protein DinB [bacterium]
MTMIDELRELFAYNRWANRRILDAAAKLGPEALDKDLGSSFPSIRATLVHILGAEWLWLSRWKGTSPTGLPDSWDLSTLDAIRARWAEFEREQKEFIDSLGEDDLRRAVSYRNVKGEPFTNTMAQMLRHVVNHSTYHRGQVITMLRQLGAEPVSTDLIAYYREHAPVRA